MRTKNTHKTRIKHAKNMQKTRCKVIV